MRMRSWIPAQQLGTAAGRHRELLRPRRERISERSPARKPGGGGAVRVGVPLQRRGRAAGAANGAAAYQRATQGAFVNDPVGQTRDDRMARLEAVLFVAKVPLHARKLGQYANLADGTEARTLMHRLNQTYDQAGRAFRVVEVAGGWQLRTRRQFSGWLRRLPHVPKQVRLSAPAMETLAVIAYRQPVVRADVESVRGVACGEIIRQLMDRDLVRVAGRSEELGRPFIYSTTKRFLEVFGLRDLDELPRADWIKQAGSQSAVIVEGENERGEGAVTLTATQHERSSEETSNVQPTTENFPGYLGSADDMRNPNLVAEAATQDDDEDDEDEETTKMKTTKMKTTTSTRRSNGKMMKMANGKMTKTTTKKSTKTEMTSGKKSKSTMTTTMVNGRTSKRGMI